MKEGAPAEGSVGPVKMTVKRLRERAVELALSHGRSSRDVAKSDWEQARQELIGAP